MSFEEKKQVGRPPKVQSNGMREFFIENGSDKMSDHRKMVAVYKRLGAEEVSTAKDGTTMTIPQEKWDQLQKENHKEALNRERRVEKVTPSQRYRTVANITSDDLRPASTQEMLESLE